MLFSVMPRTAVAQAETKIIRPKKVCRGKYEALRCEARPGNKKVMSPANHWNRKRMTVMSPIQEWRL